MIVRLTILLFTAILFASCGMLGLRKNPKLTEKQQYEFDYAFMEAAKMKMFGKMDEASALLDRCGELNPSSAAVYYEKASIEIQKGNFEPAVLHAKKAWKLNPDNYWYGALLGVLYKQSNQHAEAIAIYKTLSTQQPDRIDFLYELGSLYSTTEKYSEALEAFDAIEQQFGISETVCLEKERIYYIRGERENAYGELKKLIKAFPDDIRYYGMLAESYVAHQDYENAARTYNQLLAVDSSNGLVHLSMADFYRLTRRYDESFKELKLAFGSLDVDVDVKIKMLVSFLNFSGESEELKSQAYTLLGILVNTHPGNPKAQTLFADFLMRDRKYPEAREQLRGVVQGEKGKFLIWEQLLLLETELADYPAMLKESKEAIEYFPLQASLYYFYGLAAYKTHDTLAAIESLKKGLELVDDDPTLKTDFYSLLGEVYHRTGENALSDQAMENSLKIDKSNSHVLNNYSYYLALRGDSLSKAERMSLICIELDESNPTFLDTHAWVLYKQGKFEQALGFAEQALVHGGSQNAVIIEHYGDILFKLGRKDEAVKQWTDAFRLGKGSAFLEEKIKTKELVE